MQNIDLLLDSLINSIEDKGDMIATRSKKIKTGLHDLETALNNGIRDDVNVPGMSLMNNMCEMHKTYNSIISEYTDLMFLTFVKYAYKDEILKKEYANDDLLQKLTHMTYEEFTTDPVLDEYISFMMHYICGLNKNPLYIMDPSVFR